MSSDFESAFRPADKHQTDETGRTREWRHPGDPLSQPCTADGAENGVSLRMRRWWKTPAAVIEEYRRLLRETDYSAMRCAQMAGLCHAGATPIRAEERRYISRWRWVVKATGEIRPAVQPCPIKCAMRKTGMSEKTLGRRIKEGLLTVTHVTCNTRIFDSEELQVVKDIGLHQPGAHGKLTVVDVYEIRDRAAAGESQARIAQDYPVTRRQIGRIVNGTRWKRGGIR